MDMKEFQRRIDTGLIKIIPPTTSTDGSQVESSVSKTTDRRGGNYTLPLQIDGQDDSSSSGYTRSDEYSSSFELDSELDKSWETEESFELGISVTSTPVSSATKRRSGVTSVGNSPYAKRVKSQSPKSARSHSPKSAEDTIRIFLSNDDEYENEDILSGLGMEHVTENASDPMWPQLGDTEEPPAIKFDYGSQRGMDNMELFEERVAKDKDQLLDGIIIIIIIIIRF